MHFPSESRPNPMRFDRTTKRLPRLWADPSFGQVSLANDTEVEFDRSINSAIKKLRAALSDVAAVASVNQTNETITAAGQGVLA
jgi:hypothetical protein